jgi:hypothetical protein
MPAVDPILTNAAVYRAIATEAYARATAELDARRTPIGEGHPGHVVRYDPEQKSFKDSMIAIVFVGMYIEARFWTYGCSKLGIDAYKKVDRQPLERRLSALGILDETLGAELKAFRLARSALVHEKAVPISLDDSPLYTAQREAGKAVDLMHRVEVALRGDGRPTGAA